MIRKVESRRVANGLTPAFNILIRRLMNLAKSTQRGHVSLFTLLVGALLGILAIEAVAIPLGLFQQPLHDVKSAPRKTVPTSPLPQSEQHVADLFQNASAAVVHIETTELRRRLFQQVAHEYP